MTPRPAKPTTAGPAGQPPPTDPMPTDNTTLSDDFDLKSYLLDKRRKINERLRTAYLIFADENRVTEAMRYSMMAGGKRLRPILCIAAAEAIGAPPETVLPAACALEMIHTYSLIHDDLPAMDDDTLRRGTPTCHVAFDEATAVLAGDGLLSLAFEVLAGADEPDHGDASRWLSVIGRIAYAAGCQGMIGGQIRDILYEGRTIAFEELERMHRLKTGALIKASVLSGAVLGGGSRKQIERLETYAEAVGLAFQVTDDILNVEGDPVKLGKAVGTDERRNKTTYPSLLGLEASKVLAEAKVHEALQALDIFDKKADPLRAVARYTVTRNR
jgi:geranylgeranyl diphosphate synthase type II